MEGKRQGGGGTLAPAEAALILVMGYILAPPPTESLGLGHAMLPGNVDVKDHLNQWSS